MARKHVHHTADPLSFGLNSWAGPPAPMQLAHRHNDIELNYVEQGAITYLFGGQRLLLQPGEACLFWAAMPHQLVAHDAATYMHWVTLPLALFLRWELPRPLATAVLRGAPVLRYAPDEASLDIAMLQRWRADLAQHDDDSATIVQLELHAYLRRIAHHSATAERAAPERHATSAEHMAAFIAAHYTEPLTVAQIAASVGLHPHYAMTMFRRAYAISLVAYVTQHRIAHAQQLLVTSDMCVLDVALEAGFASTSRFYSAFRAGCGMAPAAYRASIAHASAVEPHSRIPHLPAPTNSQ